MNPPLTLFGQEAHRVQQRQVDVAADYRDVVPSGSCPPRLDVLLLELLEGLEHVGLDVRLALDCGCSLFGESRNRTT